MKPRDNYPNRTLTLNERLVDMAILAVIGFPALAKAEVKAQATDCINQSNP